jgi:hypothetical protein
MLDRSDHHARFHQRRGVADVRDMLRRGRNFEIVQIDAAKNVPCVGRGRLQLDGYRGIVMKSSSTRADFGANRRLFAQAGAPFRNCADESTPLVVAGGALLMNRRLLPLAAPSRAIKQSASHFHCREPGGS